MTTTPNPQDDGGPAFPSELTNFSSTYPIAGYRDEMIPPNSISSYSGMSLRDYFAAKALQGLCANPGGPFQACSQSGWTLVNCTFDQIAEEACALADAMLRARQENTNG